MRKILILAILLSITVSGLDIKDKKGKEYKATSITNCNEVKSYCIMECEGDRPRTILYSDLLLPDIETADGSKYEKVKLDAINVSGICIIHKNGAATINYSSLPYSMKNVFKYTPDEKEAEPEITEPAPITSKAVLDKEEKTQPDTSFKMDMQSQFMDFMDIRQRFQDGGGYLDIPFGSELQEVLKKYPDLEEDKSSTSANEKVFSAKVDKLSLFAKLVFGARGDHYFFKSAEESYCDAGTLWRGILNGLEEKHGNLRKVYGLQMTGKDSIPTAFFLWELSKGTVMAIYCKLPSKDTLIIRYVDKEDYEKNNKMNLKRVLENSGNWKRLDTE